MLSRNRRRSQLGAGRHWLAPGTAAPLVQPLERRALLALVVDGIQAAAFTEFSGPVATFELGDVEGGIADFSAKIQWGDGPPNTDAVIQFGSSPTSFQVVGTHTYQAAGSFPLAVILSGANDSEVVAVDTASVRAAVPVVTAGPIQAAINKPIDGPVATFFDPTAGVSANAFAATINWGDGSPIEAGEVTVENGVFTVAGEHTYTAGAIYQTTVTVSRVKDNAIGTGTGSAAVTPITAVTGGLDPTSDVGGNITNQARPRLSGTAPAFSLVEIFTSVPRTGTGTVLLGQTIANADGVWSLVVGPLPHGVYRPTATVTPPYGSPLTLNALDAFEVDLIPPKQDGQRFHGRGRGRVLIATLSDDGSGIDLDSLRGLRITGQAGALRRGPRVGSAARVRLIEADASASVVTLEIRPARGRFRAGKWTFAGVTDRAGNALV